MMSKVLKKLLRMGEGEQLDYKLTISRPEKIAKSLASFANHLGGTLVVGVHDDRNIRGVDPEEEKYVLDQAAQSLCDPPIPLKYEPIYVPHPTIEDEEVCILLVRIPASGERPHYVLEKNGERQLYIRQADRSLPASHQIEQQLIKGTYSPQVNIEIPKVKNTQAKQVLVYVQKNLKITVKIAAKRFNLSERRAQRLLHEMTEDGLLRAHDHEKEVYFTR